MSQQIDKTSLTYLGEDYQYKLVKEFMEDKNCFKDLAPIIDQNMFTGQYLRMYVGTMLEYLKKYGSVPSYSSMSVELKQKAHTQADIEICDAIVEKIRKTPSDGSDQTREVAIKFFKQQNIIKAAHEMLSLVGNGDIENYEKCEKLLKDALNTGTHEDYEESRVFDGMDETLSDDFRVVIPTGIGKVDDTLNGGLGKGELGVILGPTSFGKVQPYDAKIVTPNGFVDMSDIVVGSEIIGSDGKKHNVIDVFPHKDWTFFKVTFSDGTSTECGVEHLWNVRCVNSNDKTYKTMSLNDIVKSGLKTKNTNHYKYEIQLTKPVEYNEINTKIDPYTMGRMIGGDNYPSEEYSEYLSDFNSLYYWDTIFFVQHKFIHNDFLYNSIEKRVSLLNGIMDVGGEYSTEDGFFVYSTNSVMMAHDLSELVMSLGGYAIVNPINIFNKSTLYKVKFNVFDDKIKVFRNKTLYDDIIPNVNGIKNRKYIESVEFSRICDGQCIKVDADDELYLTDDYIVTHNTSLTTSMALNAAEYKSEQNGNEGFKVLQIVFEDRIKQIQRKHYSKITQIEACNLSKAEYVEYVKDILNNYENREMIQNNLRIIRLKSGEKTIEFIIELIKKHINNGFRPDMVIIDYFECIKLTGPASSSKWDKESDTMRKIESCANELNIAFWVPVQGNKDSINTDLVTMDNGGGSIGKLQISHIIMSITRSIDDIANNIATIAILKNRAGSSGRVIDGTFFNNGTCTISTDNIQEVDNTMYFNNKEYQDKKFENEKDLRRQIFLEVKNANK